MITLGWLVFVFLAVAVFMAGMCTGAVLERRARPMTPRRETPHTTHPRAEEAS